MTNFRRTVLVASSVALAAFPASAADPVRGRLGMVVAQHFQASQIGFEVLAEGGTAVDAAVATAFALAVVHPAAGNLGGGGFLLLRPAQGEPVVYDFRETAPKAATPTMFLKSGRYDPRRHHDGHLSVGVPGSVAGLHMAWKAHGKLPWPRLIEPAIGLAEEGFVVTDGLARSLRGALAEMKPYAASMAQFSRKGGPYEAGDLLVQRDLGRTLRRIAELGPAGFYEGETARLIAKEMQAHDGLVTLADLAGYRALARKPVVGSYRGFEVLSVPPPSSGGVTLLQMLNVLEGYDLAQSGFSSALTLHRLSEAMRRAYADRARYLGDPDFNSDLPIERLISKPYALEQRRSISDLRASVSSPRTFSWPAESHETTHLSVLDEARNAVALTTTLEDSYGSKIVVPGAGFLLNNEMGDFNAGPALTDATGLVGTPPNLVSPGKRMLSSMTPTILARDGAPYLIVGSPGGRSIINTVLQVILNVVDFRMGLQDAVDAKRIHHQWLPDQLVYEKHGLSPDTLALLRSRGHALDDREFQGVVEAILLNPSEGGLGTVEGASDRRRPDGAAIGR